VCLGVFAALVVPTGLFALVYGIRLWRRVHAMERTVGAPLEMLLVKLEELDARAQAQNRRTEELGRRLHDLNRSLEKVGVLSWALADARDALALWRTLTRK
jgi:hypothetical protein